MSIEYKSSSTIASSSRIFSRKEGRATSGCLKSKESISSCIFRRPRPSSLFASFLVFSCNYFTFLRVFNLSATMWAKRSPSITRSSVALWHLTRKCCLAAPCSDADISFALRISQQYDNITGNTLSSLRFVMKPQKYSQQHV